MAQIKNLMQKLKGHSLKLMTGLAAAGLVGLAAGCVEEENLQSQGKEEQREIQYTNDLLGLNLRNDRINLLYVNKNKKIKNINIYSPTDLSIKADLPDNSKPVVIIDEGGSMDDKKEVHIASNSVFKTYQTYEISGFILEPYKPNTIESQ